MTLPNRLALIIVAALAWWAFWLHLDMNAVSEHGWLAGFWHQLDYFTETTDILVAFVFSWLALTARGKVTSQALAVVTLSVIIVVLVYWPVLYPKFPPKPGTEGANVLIHAIVPACVVAYYLLFARKRSTSHADPLRWMAYPLAYTGFIMVRGVLTSKYPYFFFNPAKVGWGMVVVDIIVIGLIYFGAGHFLVTLDKRARRR
jgi:hypothetical protein